jgi:hypothetical protein
MVAEGTLTKVHALLILNDINLLNSPNVRRLLDFYSVTAGAEAKVVIKHDFEAIAERNEIPKGWLDFGIYNDSLLYVTENASGRFTKDEFRIELYLRLFDMIWRSAGIVKVESKTIKPGNPLTLVRLLELDAEDNKSQVQT